MNRRPRILLVAPPFRGHLHPVIGLGKALQALGEVRLVSTEEGVAAGRADGLEGRAVLVGRSAAVQAIAEPGRPVRGNPFRLLSQLRQNLALMDAFQLDLRDQVAEWRPDLVLADFTLPVAGRVAQEAGAAWWTVLPSPCVLEAPDGPPAYFGGEGPACTAWDHLRHALQRRMVRGFKRGIGLAFRRILRRLGFPGLYRADGSEAVYSPECILAVAFEALEFPRTWPPSLAFVGPVCHTPPAEPLDLPRVPGRRRILVTLGTHLQHEKAAFAAAARALARRHPGLDVVFTHGAPGASAGSSTPNYLERAYVPYDEGLAAFDLVVHHGGAGILAHVLRQGLPAVVAPQDFDQFDLAARLVAAGLARRIRGPRELEAAVLGALEDPAMQARCRAFRDQHGVEDGARRAAERVAAWWEARLQGASDTVLASSAMPMECMP